MATTSEWPRISYDVLRDWIQAAVLFNEADEIVDVINRLPSEYGAGGRAAAGSPHRSLKTELLSDAGVELLQQERWSDLARIFDAFDLASAEGVLAWFRLHCQAYSDRYKAGDTIRAREHLDGMLRIDKDLLGPEDLTVLAEGVWCLLRDDPQAKGIMKCLAQPELQTNSLVSEGGLSLFEQRFRMNRLNYALGDRLSPAQVIPDAQESPGRRHSAVGASHLHGGSHLGQSMGRGTGSGFSHQIDRFTFDQAFLQSSDGHRSLGHVSHGARSAWPVLRATY